MKRKRGLGLAELRELPARFLCIFGRHKYREDGRVCVRCLKLKEAEEF